MKQKHFSKGGLILEFLKGSKLFFAVCILSSAITALADMIIPQIIRTSVDNVLKGEPADLPSFVMTRIEAIGGFPYLASHMWIMAAAILVCSLVKVVFQYLVRLYNTKAAETLTKTMRDRLYSHIERLPFSWHMKNHTGDIIQRCTSDINTVKNFISEQLTSIFRILIMLALSMGFMFSMNPRLTGIALIPMPFLLGYSVVFQRKLGKGYLKCDENEGVLSAMAQENLTGVRVVRAFGRERYEKDRFEKHNKYYTGLWVRMSRLMGGYWSTGDIIAGTEILLLIVFGTVFCVRGKLSEGEFLAFISYNSMLVWPIRQLGRMIAEMSKAGVSIDRIRYIINSEEEETPAEALTPPMNEDITFDRVHFAYDGCPELLHDISFTVKAGTTLGILGGTGSGKSTLVSLLDKLYPLPEGNGKITVGGVDINQIDTGYLRRHIGIVLQEPFLFSRSLKENIGITDDSVTEEIIRSASAAACLDETVESFTAGYDTFVGERGVTLSGGQKQRAAIARTLVSDTPIMIFDDSLSAVDTETDAKIRASLEKRFGSATIFIISHRITTLSKADQILVLDNGRIAELGTHDELKSAGGIYEKIYHTQTGSAEEVAE